MEGKDLTAQTYKTMATTKNNCTNKSIETLKRPFGQKIRTRKFRAKCLNCPAKTNIVFGFVQKKAFPTDHPIKKKTSTQAHPDKRPTSRQQFQKIKSWFSNQKPACDVSPQIRPKELLREFIKLNDLEFVHQFLCRQKIRVEENKKLRETPVESI